MSAEFTKMPGMAAIVLMALSTLIMAYSSLFNIVPILVFLLLWLGLGGLQFIRQGEFIFRPNITTLLMLLVPLWACYSALWSLHSGQSLYAGLQYVSLILCVVVMARLLAFTDFIKGLAIGLIAVLILALVFDRNGLSSLHGGKPLMGLLGSKNQVGVLAEIGVVVSIVAFFVSKGFARKALYAGSLLCVSFIALILSSSATSVLTLGITLAALGGMVVVGRAPELFRGVVFASFLVGMGAAALVVYGLGIDVSAAILEGFGKSTTLTGRTDLWKTGVEAALERPLLGHGYNAFWVPGNPVAEQFWARFDIEGKSGFNFHSLYIEWFVALGGIGLGFLVVLFAVLIMGAVSSIWKNGIGAVNAFVLAMAVMFFFRGFVEVDLNGPYGLAPMIFYSLFEWLSQDRLKERSV